MSRDVSVSVTVRQVSRAAFSTAAAGRVSRLNSSLYRVLYSETACLLLYHYLNMNTNISILK